MPAFKGRPAFRGLLISARPSLREWHDETRGMQSGGRVGGKSLEPASVAEDRKVFANAGCRSPPDDLRVRKDGDQYANKISGRVDGSRVVPGTLATGADADADERIAAVPASECRDTRLVAAADGI